MNVCTCARRPLALNEPQTISPFSIKVIELTRAFRREGNFDESACNSLWYVTFWHFDFQHTSRSCENESGLLSFKRVAEGLKTVSEGKI